jgi:hypothetical protein
MLNPKPQARPHRVAAGLEPEAHSPQGSSSKSMFGPLTNEKKAQISTKFPPEASGIRQK